MAPATSIGEAAVEVVEAALVREQPVKELMVTLLPGQQVRLVVVLAVTDQLMEVPLLT
jgi:hypothetical protein